MREKSNELRSSQHQKGKVTSGSAKKYTHSSYSYHSTGPALNDEDKERLRKKQSLKDIPKNKREKTWNKMQKSDSKLDRFEHKQESSYQGLR